MKSKLIKLKSSQSSSDSIRISEHDDGCFTFTFIDDNSNGTRSYELGAKDIETIREAFLEF